MVHQSPNTRFVASQKSDTGFQAALFNKKSLQPAMLFTMEGKQWQLKSPDRQQYSHCGSLEIIFSFD